MFRFTSRLPQCRGGAAKDNVDVAWLTEKFYRITAPFLSRPLQEKVIALITGDERISVRRLVDTVNGTM